MMWAKLPVLLAASSVVESLVAGERVGASRLSETFMRLAKKEKL